MCRKQSGKDMILQVVDAKTFPQGPADLKQVLLSIAAT
jgi:hypothetical protein